MLVGKKIWVAGSEFRVPSSKLVPRPQSLVPLLFAVRPSSPVPRPLLQSNPTHTTRENPLTCDDFKGLTLFEISTSPSRVKRVRLWS